MKKQLLLMLSIVAMLVSMPLEADAQFGKLLKNVKKDVENTVKKEVKLPTGSGGSLSATNVLGAVPNKGKNIYVSKEGSNRNSGSKDAPVKDIQKAIDLAGNGDVINIAQGSYLGRLDQGFIEIKDKYISLIAGWSPDFSERDPAKYITEMRPGAAQAGTCGSKGTIHIEAKGQPARTIVIDGFAMDRGELNLYAAANVDDPRTSTPNEGVETGRIDTPSDKLSGVPTIGTFTVIEPIIRFDIEGNIVIRNCIFANAGNYGIMGAIRPTGTADVCNNIFVANMMAACQIVGNGVKLNECRVDFHHNTVLFSWCRTKVQEDMGYGYRFMTNVQSKVYNNILGCSNLGALDRGPVSSNAAEEEQRITSAENNYFFMNKGDIVLPSGGGKWLYVAAESFEDVEQLDGYEGNLQLPESESAFVDAINQDYLKGFAEISITNSSNFNPNSAANFVNRAFGLNMQGSEIVRPTMYANRYPYQEVFKLWGKVQGYGAQMPSND